MRVFLAAVLSLFVTLFVISAQQQEPSNPCSQPSRICDPRKFDEYGKLRWSDEEARLDNVAAELKLSSDNVVYLYAYNGRRGCIGEAQSCAARAKDYLVNKRGIESDRVIWRDGGHREDVVIEIWVEPRAAVAPYASPTVDPSEARLRVCKPRKQRGRSKSYAAPNNGMHPTPRHELSHARCMWARVMPSVMALP